MARARQLLIVTEDSIAEIAAAVGYPDPFYFSRQFSAVNHIQPARIPGAPGTNQRTPSRPSPLPGRLGCVGPRGVPTNRFVGLPAGGCWIWRVLRA